MRMKLNDGLNLNELFYALFSSEVIFMTRMLPIMQLGHRGASATVDTH